MADKGDTDNGQNDLSVITVEALPRQSASEATMDRQELEATGARSAQDLLRSMSGIQLSQHGSEGKSAQFFLRGFDAAHGTDITLNVDGIVLNEPSHIHGHGYADSGVVIPEAVQRVRLRKGPFELDQGSLSTAGDVTFELGVPGGRRGTAVGVESGWPLRGRAWAYYAPVEGATEDVIAAEIVGDTGPFENRSTRRVGFLGQQKFGEWKLRGALQSAEFGLPGALPRSDVETGQVGPGSTYSPDTSGQTGQAWLGVVHDNKSNARSHRTSLDMRATQFDGSENFTGYLIDDERGDERREFQRGITGVVGHRSTLSLNEDWDLIGYFGASLGRFDQFADAVDGNGEAWRRERGGRGIQGNIYAVPGVQVFFGDWLQVKGGLRLEALYFDFEEDQKIGAKTGQEVLGMVAPRLKVSLFVNGRWTLFGAVGRGFRGPEARVFAGSGEVPSNSDLRQSRGGDAHISVVDAAEFGVSFEPARNVELTATSFGYFSGAEYVYDHVSRVNVDLGTTRRLGVEAAGMIHLGESVRLRGHITAVDARFVDDGSQIPFAPPVEAGITTSGRWSNGMLAGAEWRGVSRRALPFGATAAPWSLINAYLGWAREGLEVRFLVDNLLGTSWNEGVYHYASHFDRGETRSALPSIHVVRGHPRMVRAQLSYRW